MLLIRPYNYSFIRWSSDAFRGPRTNKAFEVLGETMELADKVSDVLDRSGARIQERKALWAGLVTAFERDGVQATTRHLADRAEGIRSEFDRTLKELKKKM